MTDYEIILEDSKKQVVAQLYFSSDRLDACKRFAEKMVEKFPKYISCILVKEKNTRKVVVEKKSPHKKWSNSI